MWSGRGLSDRVGSAPKRGRGLRLVTIDPSSLVNNLSILYRMLLCFFFVSSLPRLQNGCHDILLLLRVGCELFWGGRSHLHAPVQCFCDLWPWADQTVHCDDSAVCLALPRQRWRFCFEFVCGAPCRRRRHWGSIKNKMMMKMKPSPVFTSYAAGE